MRILFKTSIIKKNTGFSKLKKIYNNKIKYPKKITILEQNRLKIEQSIEIKLFQTENHLDVKYVVTNLLLQKVLKLKFKKN